TAVQVCGLPQTVDERLPGAGAGADGDDRTGGAFTVTDGDGAGGAARSDLDALSAGVSAVRGGAPGRPVGDGALDALSAVASAVAGLTPLGVPRVGAGLHSVPPSRERSVSPSPPRRGRRPAHERNGALLPCGLGIGRHMAGDDVLRVDDVGVVLETHGGERTGQAGVRACCVRQYLYVHPAVAG